ncbi:MAG: PAS domain-containing protein [Pedobacter sp.]|nr:PAS domain-containing protein [Chitinophagaceae bacterium]
MKDIYDFFAKLFNTSDWPPRWHCGHWTNFHGWLYIISDLLVWGAYYAIPILIIRFITKKQKQQFAKIYWLFAAFILACGFTHLLDAITFWYPMYRLNALARFVTAIISWVTLYNIFKLLPSLVKLKSADELEAEIEFRKQLEKELIENNARLSEAEEISKLGHWKWTAATNLIKASPNFFKIYEAPFQEIGVRGEMHKYIHADDREFVKGRVALASQTKDYGQFYFRIVTPSGNHKTILAKGVIQLNEQNEIAFILGTIQDVTEQKAIENELLQKTDALESMNVNLQKFASVASHDLQEPLRKVSTFVSLLQRQYAPLIDLKGQELFNKTVDATIRMQQLIQSILEFSKLPTQEVKFANINLNDTLKYVLSNLELSIVEKNATITFANLPTIMANSNQLQQLFQNLISNAIKFSRFNVPPLINISAFIDKNVNDALANHFCKITITDNGIGFEEEYTEQIFLPFQRLNNRPEFEGTGIGLAICKKIVENHHGSISVKSKVGEGSTFTILLPVNQ